MIEQRESIRTAGLKAPLVIYLPDEAEVIKTDEGYPDYTTEKGDILLSDGHRRLANILALVNEGVTGFELVPCIPDKEKESSSRVLGQVIFNSGKNLTPLEQGRLYKRVLADGWEVNAIAAHVGKSVMQVENCLSLVSSRASIQKLVEAKQISSTTAINVLRETPDERRAEQILNMIADKEIAPTVAINILKKNKGVEDSIDEIITSVEEAKKEGKTTARGKHVEGKEGKEEKQEKSEGGSKGKLQLKPYLTKLVKECGMKRVKVVVTLQHDEWKTLLKLLSIEDE